MEQPQNVDLGAGGGQGVEVEIVDVDIALPVGLGLLRREQIGRVVGLGPGGADLQHAAHGGVAVDVGVVPLHVGQPGVHVGDLVDGLHQLGVGLPDAGAVGPVQDVPLGRFVVAAFHQLPLHQVLDLLDAGGAGAALQRQFPLHPVGDPGRLGRVPLAGGLQGLQNGRRDLARVVQHHPAVAFHNACDHGVSPCLRFRPDSGQGAVTNPYLVFFVVDFYYATIYSAVSRSSPANILCGILAKL